MVERMQGRLTLGYVGIFVFVLLLLGTAVVAGFSRVLVLQLDVLLEQEAQDQTRNLLDGDEREVLATSSDEFGWIALGPDGRVIDSDSAARSLGLPDRELAQETLETESPVPATIRGARGRTRVVNLPMREESGEMVGVMQYARSLEEPHDTVRRLLFVLLPLALGGVGLAVLGGRFMAGRAMRPVQESFERQRTFVADASHELKTPITLIRADAEVVLLRGNMNEEDRKLVEHALAETDRMNAVLSDLLLVARLDAGRLIVASKPFDLASVLATEAERFDTRAAGKDVRIEVQASSGLLARGDVKMTGQILAVLLDNGLGFTPPGGVVHATARLDGRWAEVSVTDTGPGIAPEHLPRVFDRFYRAEAARTRNEGGTGLGLAIARDLARAQEGDLTVENADGRGATFRLRLPREGDRRASSDRVQVHHLPSRRRTDR